MAEDQPKFDPRLEEGIAYFEKMLQVMPDDRTTLEFLCVAYEQIGEDEKRRKALISLAGILLRERDLEAAASIGEHLAKYREPDAQAAVLRIKAACRANETVEPTADSTPSEAPVSAINDDTSAKTETTATVAMAAEAKLLQMLVRDKVLDEEMANAISQKITDIANFPGCFLISALRLLEKENSALAESAAAHVADASGAPPIPLEVFDFPGELLQSLPESLMRMRGVLPFARLAGALLVAMLNPLDQPLRQEIETLAACPCLFYTAHPRTMEETLERLFVYTKDSSEEPTAAEGTS